ncbi:MAG: phosphodiester glycosidase family protein [Proteobacteria bacterium]|nr:phosphodiester glycosidase family protein [Pseudomonadota bacterium]
MRLVPIIVVLGTATIARATPVRQSTAAPHPGIVHEVWRDAAIPADLQLIRIDLTASEIAMHATREQDKGHTTTYFAVHGEAPSAVAINGGPFSVPGYHPRGFAMGASLVWSQSVDDAQLAVLHLRRVGERTIATIAPPEEVTTSGGLPLGTEGAVSGGPMLVRASNVQAPFACDDPITVACVRAPRTAIGISADGNTLIAVVVDGWQASSHGMKADELATFLRARGAADAIMLDSGASSTMVIDDAIANHPSDGVERVVANHLGWGFGSLPKGDLTGVICRDTISACQTPGSPDRITGAKVTLDDGRVLTSTSTGCPDGALCASYDFAGVTPRLACVTVQKVGFRTAHKCAQVRSGGEPTYNSVVLVAGDDPPDAGVPLDASETVGDGGDPPDLTDGGTQPPTPVGDGCCDAAGRELPRGGLLMMALTGWFLSRRRGTTRTAQ